MSADDRRAARRSALIDAAFDLLAEGGIPAVSKRAVCARARLNDRYFYESFVDTDALLEAIVREQTELGLAAVRLVMVEPADLHAQVRSLARDALDFLTADPRRGALLLGSRRSDVLQRERNDSARAIAGAISAIGDDGIGSADTNRLEREVAAYALVSGAMEVIEAWLRDELATSREHLADLIAELLAALPVISARLPRPEAGSA